MSRISITSPTRPGHGRLRLGLLVAAAALIAIGGGAVVKGIDGHATAQTALQAEQIKGEPFMSPTGIVAKAKQAGLTDVQAPGCTVANKSIASGSDARCFAQYMRVDALIATHGKLYSQMPRFLDKAGKPTNDVALAALTPQGQPMPNLARNVWVTETALTTALNVSYMAEQVSLFGIAVGAALLLVGITLGGFGLSGVRVTSTATARGPVAEPATA